MKLTNEMLKENRRWSERRIGEDIYSRGIRNLMALDFDSIEIYDNLVKVEKINLGRKEVALYDCYGNLIFEKKKSVMFLTYDLIRVESFDNKFALYNTEGRQLLSFDYSVIEVISDMLGCKYLKVQRSEFEHGLYRLDLQPIVPCGNNYIYYQELTTGGPIRVRWEQTDMISYIVDEGRLRAIS